MKHILIGIGIGILSLFTFSNASALSARTVNTIIEQCMGKKQWPNRTSQEEIDKWCEQFSDSIEIRRQGEAQDIRNNAENSLRSKQKIQELETEVKNVKNEINTSSEEENEDYENLPDRLNQLNQQLDLARNNKKITEEKSSQSGPRCQIPEGGWTNSVRDRVRRKLCGSNISSQKTTNDNSRGQLTEEISEVRQQIRYLQIKLRSLLKQLEDAE